MEYAHYTLDNISLVKLWLKVRLEYTDYTLDYVGLIATGSLEFCLEA